MNRTEKNKLIKTLKDELHELENPKVNFASHTATNKLHKSQIRASLLLNESVDKFSISSTVLSIIMIVLSVIMTSLAIMQLLTLL